MSVDDNQEVKTEKGRPTLKTVADACGLAVTTVSRALNDGDDIALKTRARVKDVANQLGYVPNRAGRGLRTGKSHMISLVVAPHASISGYTSAIINGIGEVCRDSGYELSATPEFTDGDELAAIRSIVQNQRADGILLSRIKPQDLRVRYLIEIGFPFVTHGRTELASDHAYVDFDNQLFAELGAKRMAERGRKKLMLIGPPKGLTYGAHMHVGIERSVVRSDIELIDIDESIHLETPLSEIRSHIAHYFSKQCANSTTDSDLPDGIVCGGELAAMATMAGLRDAGITPGLEVDVFAKQTSAAMDYLNPSIDSCYEDIDATGRLLGESLLSVIAGDSDSTLPKKVISPKLVLRTSN